MYNYTISGKKQNTLIEELASLEKELKRLDVELSKAKGLEKLLRIAIKAKNDGKDGFYIPPELAHLEPGLKEILQEGAKIFSCGDEIKLLS